MLDKLKEFWEKFKSLFAFIAAGIAIFVLLFKSRDTESMGEYFKKEDEAKDAARNKIEIGSKEVEDEKQKLLREAEEEKRKLLKQAESDARKEERKLKLVQKVDEKEFESILEKELGVKKKGE